MMKRAQAGAALLMAMLTVALVATFAAAAPKQRQVTPHDTATLAAKARRRRRSYQATAST